MTTLRQRMIDDLRIRNRSADTIRIYIDCVKHFARHFGKSPELLGPEEIRQYQVYLVNQRHVSSSYLTQTVCALRFLYALPCSVTGPSRAFHIQSSRAACQSCSARQKSNNYSTRFAVSSTVRCL